LQERAREGEREQRDHGTTQEKKENVFQPAALRDAWGRGLEKHQRTENHFLARTAPDEVKEKGQGDGGRTGQE
jgi:hypothetical protein